MTINPGICKVVKLLNDNGFTTCDSGDGVTHDYACDRDAPYVCITVAPLSLCLECIRLVGVMRACGITIKPIGPHDDPCIQGTYDPANDIATIELMGVNDSMLSI